MKQHTIAIDIDDVLADFAKGFVVFSNDRWGTHLTIDDYDEHWAKIWQVDNATVEARSNELHGSGMIRDLSSRDDARHVLEGLSTRYHLIVITSRRSQLRDDTLDWLSQHYPMIDTSNVTFAGFWDGTITDESVKRTKADIAKGLGADYLIDDQLKHCLAASAAGIESILFGDYSWNQIGANEMPDNMRRLSSWSEVDEYFAQRP